MAQAKKSRSSRASARRANIEATARAVAHDAAQQALTEQSREHTIEILRFGDNADIFLDGDPVREYIKDDRMDEIGTILSKIGTDTRAFTVVIHDHSKLFRGE